MKLLRRLKPIIGKGQTDLARLPLHLFTHPIAPYLVSMHVEWVKRCFVKRIFYLKAIIASQPRLINKIWFD